MAKKKKSLNVLYLIGGAVVLIMVLGKSEVPPQSSVGCTNTCSFGFNQNPHPDCSCYLAQQEEQETDGCVDSDGGQNKDTPGHVTLGDMTFLDECWDDTEVKETFCGADGAMDTVFLDCEYDYANDKPLETCIETASGAYCEDLPTYQEGEVIATGSGTVATTTGEEVYDIISLDIGDNPCVLGLRLNVMWSSWNDNNYPAVDGACFNMNEQDWQKLYIFVQDSNAIQYSDVMSPAPPTQRQVDVCPMDWSRYNPDWLINILPDYDEFDFPPQNPCSINYQYSYEIYNCQCPI